MLASVESFLPDDDEMGRDTCKRVHAYSVPRDAFSRGRRPTAEGQGRKRAAARSATEAARKTNSNVSTTSFKRNWAMEMWRDSDATAGTLETAAAQRGGESESGSTDNGFGSSDEDDVDSEGHIVSGTAISDFGAPDDVL
jgi:hypothetical protein